MHRLGLGLQELWACPWCGCWHFAERAPEDVGSVFPTFPRGYRRRPATKEGVFVADAKEPSP